MAVGELSALGRAGAAVSRLGDVVLLSHAQIFFTRRRLVGALLLAAALTHPRAGLTGVAAVLLSSLVVRIVGFSDEHARLGLYGYNPLLCGLALGTFLEPSRGALALLVLAVVAVVLLQSALENALGHLFNLPVLSLPFVLVALAALASAPVMVQLKMAPVELLTDGGSGIGAFFGLYLRSLGAIFFAPRLASGLLVLAALIVFSRIAVMLSLLGFAVGWLVLGQVSVASPLAPLVVGYNAILTAVALGGIWFVPQRSAFALAAAGVLLTAFLSVSAIVLLAPLRLPALILPFNLCMLVSLHAMRQRVRDGAPKSVDFVAGTPEENLHHYRTRLARFGGALPVRFSLPCFGRWTVTQGVDGSHTHRGEWRHALDFEVRDREGQHHAGLGTALKDYYCYRLPVFAAAAGTVVSIVGDVPDNAVGQRGTGEPWGNLVLLQHAPSLYSLVCHLAPGSVEVVPGQYVAAGARLGLCGNSGRSFVPHLHFQLQSSPRVGAPTRALELHDVVVEPDAGPPTLLRVCVPTEGQSLRNPVRRDEVAALLAFPLGARMTFELDDGRSETIASRIDLYNNLYLETEGTDSRLYYEIQGRQLLIHSYQGSPDSALHLLYSAAPRVPLEPGAGLSWDDVLPERHFRPRAASWLLDLIDPFLPAGGQPLELTSERDGGALIVRGRGRRGGQELSTTARFVDGTGLVELAVDVGAVRRSAKRARIDRAAPDEAAAPGPSARIGSDGKAAADAAAATPRITRSKEQRTMSNRLAWLPLVLLALAAPAAADETSSELYRRSYAAEGQGDNAAALATLERVGARGVHDYVYTLRHGWLLYLAGRYAEAATAYGEAIQLEPAAVEPRLGAMLPLMALRRWKEAETRAREVLERAPGDFTAQSRIAYIHYTQGRFPEAETWYRKALAGYPSNVEMRTGLGWSLLKQNKLKEAAAEFQRVLAVAPDHANAKAGLTAIP